MIVPRPSAQLYTVTSTHSILSSTNANVLEWEEIRLFRKKFGFIKFFHANIYSKVVLNCVVVCCVVMLWVALLCCVVVLMCVVLMCVALLCVVLVCVLCWCVLCVLLLSDVAEKQPKSWHAFNKHGYFKQVCDCLDDPVISRATIEHPQVWQRIPNVKFLLKGKRRLNPVDVNRLFSYYMRSAVFTHLCFYLKSDLHGFRMLPEWVFFSLCGSTLKAISQIHLVYCCYIQQ